MQGGRPGHRRSRSESFSQAAELLQAFSGQDLLPGVLNGVPGLPSVAAAPLDFSMAPPGPDAAGAQVRDAARDPAQRAL